LEIRSQYIGESYTGVSTPTPYTEKVQRDLSMKTQEKEPFAAIQGIYPFAAMLVGVFEPTPFTPYKIRETCKEIRRRVHNQTALFPFSSSTTYYYGMIEEDRRFHLYNVKATDEKEKSCIITWDIDTIGKNGANYGSFAAAVRHNVRRRMYNAALLGFTSPIKCEAYYKEEEGIKSGW
jgi:hypothetical protein